MTDVNTGLQQPSPGGGTPVWRRVDIPEGVDLSNEKIRDQLATRLSAAFQAKHGPDWRFSHFDARSAVFVPRTASSSLITGAEGTMTVTLSKDTPMSSWAALETQFKRILDADKQTYPRPQGTNWWLTGYQPLQLRITMGALTDREHYVREALATGVFKCAPWEIQVRENLDKTISLALPHEYLPTKHDQSLQDVVSAKIGRPGWWVDADPKTYLGTIHPGELPTFAKRYESPVAPRPSWLKVEDQMVVPVGVKLGGRGKKNSTLFLDFNISPHLLATGQTRGGKTAFVNQLVYQVVARGWQLVVCNTPDKNGDVAWMRPFCRPGGYGEAAKNHTMAALALLREEMTERSQAFAQLGAQKWQDLTPADRQRFPLILSLIDEVPQLLLSMMAKSTAKELDEDDPRRIEAMADFVSTALISYYLGKLVKVAAAFGICIAMSSQGATQTDGVPKNLRLNMGNRILCGTNPDTGVFDYAFRGKNLPTVPEWIANDPDPAVGKGAGVAEFDGQEPCVYKGFFEPDTVYAERLRSIGAPTTSCPEPTDEQIARFAASGGGDEDLTEADWNQTRSPISGRSLSSIAHDMGDDWDVDESGQRVTGFAKANLARHLAATTT